MSKIRHVAGDRLVVVRESFIRLCDADHCAAMLLSSLVYWHEWAVDRESQEWGKSRDIPDHQAEEGWWFYKSTDDLVDDLLGLYKRDKVMAAVRFLEAKGFLEIRTEDRGNSRIRYFQVNPEVVQKAVDGLPKSVRQPHRSKNRPGGKIDPVEKSTGDDGSKNRPAAGREIDRRRVEKSTPFLTEILRDPRDPSSSSTLQDPADVTTTTIESVASEFGVLLDGQVSRQIAERCKAVCPDITAEEIAWFLRSKIEQLGRGVKVRNWPGMLLAALPVSLKGGAVADLRARLTKERQTVVATAESVLDDPEATEGEREWARGVLGGDGSGQPASSQLAHDVSGTAAIPKHPPESSGAPTGSKRRLS